MIGDYCMFGDIFLISVCCSKGHCWFLIWSKIRFVEVSSYLQFADLCADVPVGIVISGIGTWIYFGRAAFGYGLIGES